MTRAALLFVLLVAGCGGEMAPPAYDAGCHLVPTGTGALFDFNIACDDGGALDAASVSASEGIEHR